MRRIAAEHIIATGNKDKRWTDVYLHLEEEVKTAVETLQAIIKQMGEQACVLAKDGMAAKAQVEALQREREQWVQAVGLASTCAGDMEIDVTKPIEMMQVVCQRFTTLKTALDAEREKVKAAKAEVWREAAMKYALWVGEDSEVPADPHLDGYERFEEYCRDRATLDATPTERRQE